MKEHTHAKTRTSATQFFFSVLFYTNEMCTTLSSGTMIWCGSVMVFSTLDPFSGDLNNCFMYSR